MTSRIIGNSLAIRLERDAEKIFAKVLMRIRWSANDRDALADELRKIVTREMGAKRLTENED